MAISQIPAAGISSVSATTVSSGTLPKAQLPTGTIVQVVSTLKQNVTSTNVDGWVDVSGLSLSITPTSASNRILLMTSVFTGSTADGGVRLLRDGIEVGNGTGGNAWNGFGQSAPGPNNNLQYQPNAGITMVVDSPNTTSAVTYKVQFRVASGTLYINTRSIATSFGMASSIIAMEVTS